MKHLNKLILVLCGAILTGCVHNNKPKHTQVTAATSQELDNLGATLSQAEGKAVIIREWLKAQN